LDETCVKVNGLEYWVYAVLDVDRNEIYDGLSTEKYSYHQQFIDEVLNYCIGGPAFIVDNALWLNMHWRS
jgi:transposase-like protein